MQCPKCGAEIQESDKFCFACGSRIEAAAYAPAQTRMTCRRCGAALSEHDKFCGRCGAAVSLAPQGPPVPGVHETRPHRSAAAFGYVLTFAGAFMLVAGFVIMRLPVAWDDIGLLPVFGGLICLVISMLVPGIYLWSRKQPSAKRHGRIVFFLSLILLLAGVVLLKMMTLVI